VFIPSRDAGSADKSMRPLKKCFGAVASLYVISPDGDRSSMQPSAPILLIVVYRCQRPWILDSAYTNKILIIFCFITLTATVINCEWLNIGCGTRDTQC
jgi:hypothetical protein